jgi:hypothetical protein
MHCLQIKLYYDLTVSWLSLSIYIYILFCQDYNAWGGLDWKDKSETEMDLQSRGLCLVPVSCTPQVYRDNNGPDYWTPPYRSCLYRWTDIYISFTLLYIYSIGYLTGQVAIICTCWIYTLLLLKKTKHDGWRYKFRDQFVYDHDFIILN